MTSPRESLPAAMPGAGRRGTQARRKGLIAARIAAVVLGLLLPLVVVEFGLRWFGPFLPGNYDTGPYIQRHPALGHFHVPGADVWVKSPWYTSHIVINSMGLRDPRTAYDKPPGTFRLLALGDSFVEAIQVPMDQAISTRLEQALGSSSRAVEVINAGVLGYGTTQELLLLDTEGVKYQPDVIVLFFCHCNDVANNNYRLELIDQDLGRSLKPYLDLDEGGALRLLPAPPPPPLVTLRSQLRGVSAFYNMLESGGLMKLELHDPRSAWGGVDGLLEPLQGKYDVRPTGEWKRAWDNTAAILAVMRDRAAALGTPLVVVSIPEWRMVDQAYWRRSSVRRRLEDGTSHPHASMAHLDAILQQLGVPHLDLTPAFEERARQDGVLSLHIDGDFHWTAAGHALAAAEVARFLQSRGLAP